MKRIIVPLAAALAIAAACATQSTPSAPSGIAANGQGAIGLHDNHNSAADADKGYITGWVDGEEVELYYTKSFFCQEPPSSGADSECEIGAPAATAPRPGPIPTIYAIAAAATMTPQPDPATLSCRAGTACLNHPRMIDLSRIFGSGASNASPDSNVRVR